MTSRKRSRSQTDTTNTTETSHFDELFPPHSDKSKRRKVSDGLENFLPNASNAPNARTNAPTTVHLQLSNQEKEVIISDIIRFMLFKHASKTPIRRRDLIENAVKKTYSGKLPILNQLLKEAQSRMRHLFGMEFVPINKTIPEGENSMLFRIPVDELTEQKTKKSPEMWILRVCTNSDELDKLNGKPGDVSEQSTMNTSRHAQSPHQHENGNSSIQNQRQSPNHATMHSENDASLDQSLFRNPYTKVFTHCAELNQENDSVANFGLLMIILALLVCSHDHLEESVLWNRLSTFGIEKSEEHPVFGYPEKVIEDFTKELYLTKMKDETESRETSEETGTQVSIHYYTFGPRIHEEMHPEHIVEFLQDITGTGIPESIKREIQKYKLFKERIFKQIVDSTTQKESQNATQSGTQVSFDEEN